MENILGNVGDKTIERTNALTLIHDSREYYEYYLRGKPNKNNDISKVSYFLLLRSLELALKALIKINEGMPVKKLREKYKHNIYKLYSYCLHKKYLTESGEEERIAIHILSGFYKNKDFEYTTVGYKSIPVISYPIILLKRIYEEFDLLSKNIKIQKYL